MRFCELCHCACGRRACVFQCVVQSCIPWLALLTPSELTMIACKFVDLECCICMQVLGFTIAFELSSVEPSASCIWDFSKAGRKEVAAKLWNSKCPKLTRLSVTCYMQCESFIHLMSYHNACSWNSLIST